MYLNSKGLSSQTEHLPLPLVRLIFCNLDDGESIRWGGAEDPKMCMYLLEWTKESATQSSSVEWGSGKLAWKRDLNRLWAMPDIISNKVWKKHLHCMRICTSPPSAKLLCWWDASDYSIDFLLLISDFILSMLSNQGFLGLERDYPG